MDVGVAGVLPRAHDRDQDRLGHAAEQQIAEQVRLGTLERRDRRVSSQEGLGDVEDVLALAHEGLERRRHVEDERGVRHVAEVDDARHPELVVEEEVVQRHVVMDDL